MLRCWLQLMTHTVYMDSFFTYCKIQSDLWQNVILNSLLTSVISYFVLCNECRMHDYRFLIFRCQSALCEYNSVEWKHIGISNFIVILCFMYCTSLSDTPSVCPGGKIKITGKTHTLFNWNSNQSRKSCMDATQIRIYLYIFANNFRTLYTKLYKRLHTL